MNNVLECPICGQSGELFIESIDTDLAKYTFCCYWCNIKIEELRIYQTVQLIIKG